MRNYRFIKSLLNHFHLRVPFNRQFTIIIILSALVVIQGFTHFINLRLDGYVNAPQKVELNFKTYCDGSYMDYLSKAAKFNGGFREFFIRAYNQMQYTVFGKSTNNNVIKGKEGEYYLKMYVDEVIGETAKEFFGSVDAAKQNAVESIEKMKVLIDSLKRNGTKVLFVSAPSKTALYPEFLPDNIIEDTIPFCLQEYYADIYKKEDFEHVDFLAYFKKIKSTEKRRIYTKYGTHWADFVVPFIADSLLQKIEEMTGVDMPDLEITDNGESTKYSKGDKELESQMNLLFPLSKPSLPKNTFKLADGAQKSHLNLLVIGDSYFNQFINSPFVDCFAHWDFWRYNREIVSSTPGFGGIVGYFQSKYKVISGADIVMFFFTTRSYYTSYYGFYETAMEAFNDKDCTLNENAINELIETIKADEKWFKYVKRQSKEKGISIEEGLRNNAIWFLNHKKNEQQ